MKKEQLLGYSAFLFALVLPLSTGAGNLALGLFLFVSLFNIDYRQCDWRHGLNCLKYTTAIFFIMYVFGFVVSGDMATGLDQFGKKLFYLICPFVICFLTKEQLQKTKKYSLIGLVFGCVISSLFLIFHNLYIYYLTRPLFSFDQDLFNFYYTSYNFSKILKIHPSYLGTYFVLALVYLLYFSTFKKVIRALLVGVIVVAILFLNARIIYALTVIAFLVFFIGRIRLQYKRNKFFCLFLSGVFILIVFIGLTLLNNTYISTKFMEELKWDLSDEVGTKYNYSKKGDSRLSRWKAGIAIIKKQPITGYGLQEEKKELINEYKRRKMEVSVLNGYDAHNQFISVFIQFGIMGLLLVFYFTSNFCFAITSKDVMYISIAIIILFVCTVENYLGRNAGIIFTAFFNSIFLVLHLSNKRKAVVKCN